MDENLSWRAKLAKANINILSLSLVRTGGKIMDRWFVEFTYHPKPGVFKWCKTYIDIPNDEVIVPDDDPVKWHKTEIDPEQKAQQILESVLKLRKELED